MKGIRLNKDLRDQFETVMELHRDREIVAIAIPPEWYGGFKIAVGMHQIQTFTYGIGEEMYVEVSLRKECPATELGCMVLLGDDLYIYRHSRKFKVIPEGGETGFDPLTEAELFDLSQ